MKLKSDVGVYNSSARTCQYCYVNVSHSSITNLVTFVWLFLVRGIVVLLGHVDH